MTAEQEIWEAIVRTNRQWLGGNPEGVAGLFHQDVVVAVPGSGERRHGREAMVRSFADYVREVDTLAFQELDHNVDVMGDLAVVTYRFSVRYEINGTTHDEIGREILVFVRSQASWSAIWRMQLPVSEREAPPPSSTRPQGRDLG